MTIAAATLNEGTSCKPNISAAGRRLRRRFGWVWLAVTLAGLAASVGWRSPWSWRALLAVPAALAAIGFLQARRGTCVSRAAEGTFEHEDFTKTSAPNADAARSRRAASAIVRDTVLLGLLGGALAIATAILR